jgi:hypothetical protein
VRYKRKVKKQQMYHCVYPTIHLNKDGTLHAVHMYGSNIYGLTMVREKARLIVLMKAKGTSYQKAFGRALQQIRNNPSLKGLLPYISGAKEYDHQKTYDCLHGKVALPKTVVAWAERLPRFVSFQEAHPVEEKLRLEL